MVPCRITLRGFLSFRDQQTLEFTDAPLWMLAGPNGSGKSAVFDSVTYALFGWHRGGAKDAGELINKECDAFSVEFEFALGDDRFQIRRTHKKRASGSGASTQQISQWLDSRWSAVAETNQKRQFDAWIDSRIGLRYETFTSSVLLLQGQSEKLLGKTAADRFKVLSDIVDLERYARLHARVDEARKKLKAFIEVLQNQVAGIPEVSSDEWTGAEARVAEIEAERERKKNQLESLIAAEHAAQRWAELNARLEAARSKRQSAETLLAGSDAIERDATRLAELNRVIPLAEVALRERAGVEDSKRVIAEATEKQQLAAAELTKASAAIQQIQQKRVTLMRDAAADECTRSKLNDELQHLAGDLVKVELLERTRAELASIEKSLSQVPADLDVQIAAAKTRVDDLSTLDRALPELIRIHRDREQLAERTQQSKSLTEQLGTVTAAGQAVSAELAKLEPLAQQRSEEMEKARADAASAETIFRQAERDLRTLDEMQGEANCRVCGQKLTAAHMAEETSRRTMAFDDAGQKVRASIAARESCETVHRELASQIERLRAERQQRREEFHDIKRQADQAALDANRLTSELNESQKKLPDQLRLRLGLPTTGDWLATRFPSKSDLTEIQSKARDLAAAQDVLQRLNDMKVQSGTKRTHITSLRRSIEEMKAALRSSETAIRERGVGARADAASLDARIIARRKETERIDQESERLGKTRDDLQARASALDATLQTESAKRKLRQQQLDAAHLALPDAWRPLIDRSKLSDQHVWKSERDELSFRNVERLADELRLARAGLDRLKADEAAAERELETVPLSARRLVADVRTEIEQAKTAERLIEQSAKSAAAELHRLESRRRERQSLTDQLLQADRDHAQHAKLTELLSRDRLQGTLIRRAERQIVDQANIILDRLSDGQLFLQIRGGSEPENALDLESINRAAGGSAIPVAFLSGSQRFRVAVSLALGIGRYACGQHRPIESVIIDEGFGCLDRNGRQSMIQELQHLRGFLKRILLVSHQEEFADAFPDGYRFELVNGATRVSRFHR
jgi:DNA repair exonuclease SbcCD ATPase subunit